MKLILLEHNTMDGPGRNLMCIQCIHWTQLFSFYNYTTYRGRQKWMVTITRSISERNIQILIINPIFYMFISHLWFCGYTYLNMYLYLRRYTAHMHIYAQVQYVCKKNQSSSQPTLEWIVSSNERRYTPRGCVPVNECDRLSSAFPNLLPPDGAFVAM